jgi:DNA polymerase I-like protein with 3'-5' exonuclease and polymerase domains
MKMTTNYEFNYFYDTTWQPPDVFPDLTNSKNMAIDLETCDPNIKTRGPGWPYKDGYIVGFAIAAGDFAGYYPIAHAGGGNIDKNIVLRWVKKQLATPDIPKIMHNAMYDAGWLQTEGIEVQGKIIDTMIAAPLVDENRFSYSLDSLGKHYLDMRKDERTLRERASEFGFDAKADLWRMPSQFVGEYAEMDAVLTLRLWEHLSAIINKEELTSVFELETGLIPVVLEMRRRGVRVDLDVAEQAKDKLNSSYNNLWQEIYKETNVELEPWAAVSVAQVFDSLDLHYNKTKTDQPSFTKSFLNEHSHPIAACDRDWETRGS